MTTQRPTVLPVPPAAAPVLVLGDLEATRLVCALLRDEGREAQHLLAPDEEALRVALAGPVAGVAVVVRGDLLALRLTLLVEHLKPGVPVVVTIFDRTLGRHLERVVPRCTVTSPADVAAPAVVAACLGPGALAVSCPPTGPRAAVLRDGAVVLERWASTGPRRLADRLVPRRYGGAEGLLLAGLAGLGAIVGLEWVMAAAILHEGPVAALYGAVRLVATVGPAEADLHDAPAWYLVLSAVLMLVGIAATGALVAGLVEWVTSHRTAAVLGRRRVPGRDHVVVAGLGQVGVRVAQLLRGLGVPVVVVERMADSPNLGVAKGSGIPVVIGDAGSRRLLGRVSATRARAVAALGSDDLDNVAVAINALAVAPGVRTVLRAGEGALVRETTSLFRVGTVADVGAMTAAWVCATLRGDRPEATWTGSGRVGVLGAGGSSERDIPQRCSCPIPPGV